VNSSSFSRFDPHSTKLDGRAQQQENPSTVFSRPKPSTQLYKPSFLTELRRLLLFAPGRHPNLIKELKAREETRDLIKNIKYYQGWTKNDLEHERDKLQAQFSGCSSLEQKNDLQIKWLMEYIKKAQRQGFSLTEKQENLVRSIKNFSGMNENELDRDLDAYFTKAGVVAAIERSLNFPVLY
jgi:hypothetical protein